MNPVARCDRCRREFEAPSDRVGGLMNCPGCGVAVEIKGLRDPLYRALQLVGAVVVVAVVAGIGHALGPIWGVGVGVVLALLFALVRIGL